MTSNFNFFMELDISGGKQPLMKDGYFEKDGERVPQSMVFTEGPNNGLAKGLKQVCLERFGPDAVKGKLQDDLGLCLWLK